MKFALLKVAICFLLVSLGISFAALYVAAGKVNVLTINLKSSESNARVGWGLYYDLQDKNQRHETTEINKLQVDLWNLQRQLDVCQNSALVKK